MSRPALPIVFFAFANDRVDKARYLRNLPEELRQVREAMTPAEQANLCEMEVRSNATVVEVLDFFQDARFRNRVAIFHFGGHAGSGVLLFESPEGAARAPTPQALPGSSASSEASPGLPEWLLDAGSGPESPGRRSPGGDRHLRGHPGRGRHGVVQPLLRALASGAPLRAAFNEVAAVQTRTGQRPSLGIFTSSPAPRRRRPLEPPRGGPRPLFGLPSCRRWTSRRALQAPGAVHPRGRPRLLRPWPRDPRAVRSGDLIGCGSDRPPLRCRRSWEVLAPRRRPPAAPRSLPRRALPPPGQRLGLTGTLAQALPDWRQREEAGKPLIVILDQVEEAWTRPLTGGGEIEAFASLLARSSRCAKPSPGTPHPGLPQGMAGRGPAAVGRRGASLRAGRSHPSRPERRPGSRRRHRVDRPPEAPIPLGDRQELPALIAVDLLRQQEDTIAPILQILFTKMWAHATAESPESPRFTVDLYQGHGAPRPPPQRLPPGAAPTGSAEWQPELVDSGLVLDLLAYHTTPLSTAETHRGRGRRALQTSSGGPGASGEMQRPLPLAVGTGSRHRPGPIGLAHDTLAPLVRQRFESSDLPGQTGAAHTATAGGGAGRRENRCAVGRG